MIKSIKKPWGSYIVLNKSKDFLIKKREKSLKNNLKKRKKLKKKIKKNYDSFIR